jgi:ferritin-like metal-binding protein YciE
MEDTYRSKNLQARTVPLEAEVFELMTKWIERHRREAEKRYQRLDAVLAAMNAKPNTNSSTTKSNTKPTARHPAKRRTS